MSADNDVLAAALKWAAAGWRVFPLTPNGKEPLPESHGFLDAASDPAVVSAMPWQFDGVDCNVGVATGAGLVVIDVDVKHGKDGWKALAAVGITREYLDGLNTYSVTTPTNGKHYWFRSGEPVKSGSDILGKGSGVDLRAEKAYIVVPPSRRPEGIYNPSRGNACDPEDNLPQLPLLADWSVLGGKIHRPVSPPSPPRPSIPISDDEKRRREERAMGFLAKCEGAISGQGGHNRTFAVASALVNGFLLSPEAALRLLKSDYNRKCSPPWSENELQHKVDDALRAGPPDGKEPGWLLKSDGRAVTSPVNGAHGGRPQIDCDALVRGYKEFYQVDVRWGKSGYKEYDPRLGAYRPRTAAEMSARVGAFLTSGFVSGVKYSKSLEGNVVAALRATPTPELEPPIFLSTGKSAKGWIAMKNGLLDVEAAARGETINLLGHSPDFFSYRTLPYEWLPDAPCPRFMRFLNEVQPDAEGRAMMQMLAGLLLVEDTQYEAFFILIGEGGTGKSTFLRILKKMLGPENVCSIPLYRFSEKHLTVKMASALANLVDEAPNADLSRWGSLAASESILKSVTSGGEVHVEPKGVDADDRPATARCVFCQNPPLPPFSDRSNGLWRRLRVIPFNVVFDGTANEENNLAETIAATELPGIFAWAVRGLGQLRKLKAFPQCEAGAALIAETRGMLDKEGAFLRENYQVKDGAFTVSADLTTAYVEWCKAEKYPSPKGPQALAADIKRIFPAVKYHSKIIDGKKKRGWLNLSCVGFRFDYLRNRLVQIS